MKAGTKPFGAKTSPSTWTPGRASFSTAFPRRTARSKAKTSPSRSRGISFPAPRRISSSWKKGDITSSPNIPANYHIEASKIWIFGPGEWGLQNATLYVGHIPLFYFPFFFYPGDEAVFHPTFGYRTREGTFMETTTYFIGNRKNNADSAFSFLQLTDNEANDKVKERHGLFLRDTDKKIEHPDWYVKALFDVYSRLGAFAGVQGDLPQFTTGIKTLTFRGGLGVSRNLYTDKVPGFLDSYTPYWTDANGDVSTHWNSTHFLGTRLPFRYLFETNLVYTINTLSLNFLIENYSDPYLDQDFFNRKEEMDWANLLEGNFEQATTASLKESLTWKIDGSYTPKVDALSPYVSSLTLSRFLLALTWRAKDVVSTSLADYDRDVSPTRRFYYPYNLQMPDFSAQASGTLFSSEARKDTKTPADGKKSAGGKAVQDLKPPWELDEPPKEETQEETYKIPDLRTDITVSSFALPLSYSLKYNLSPKVTYALTANPEEWTEPADVKYDFAYSTVTLQNTAQLLYNLQVYDQIFKTSGTLSLISQYQNIDFLNESMTEAMKTSLLLSAYRYSSTTLTNSVDFATYPLSKDEIFKASNIRYSNTSVLYKKTYTTMDGETPVYSDHYFRLTDQMITANKVSMEIKAEIPYFTPSVSAYYICPPLDEIFNLSGALVTGPLTSSVTFQTKKKPERCLGKPTHHLFRESEDHRQRQFLLDLSVRLRGKHTVFFGYESAALVSHGRFFGPLYLSLYLRQRERLGEGDGNGVHPEHREPGLSVHLQIRSAVEEPSSRHHGRYEFLDDEPCPIYGILLEFQIRPGLFAPPLSRPEVQLDFDELHDLSVRSGLGEPGRKKLAKPGHGPF